MWKSRIFLNLAKQILDLARKLQWDLATFPLLLAYYTAKSGSTSFHQSSWKDPSKDDWLPLPYPLVIYSWSLWCAYRALLPESGKRWRENFIFERKLVAIPILNLDKISGNIFCLSWTELRVNFTHMSDTTFVLIAWFIIRKNSYSTYLHCN